MRSEMDKLFVLTSLICLVLICNNVELSKFVWKYSNKRHTFFSNTSTTASSREDCASLCHRMRHCQSFQYNRNTGLCSTHPVSFETSTWDFEAADLLDNVVFYKQDSRGIGTRCSSTDQCPVINSTCFNGVCVCEPGLSFNQADNTCVEGCSQYSTRDATVYHGIGIKDNNIRTLRNVKSLKDCYKACVKQTSFLCLTFDLVGRTCLLQNVTFLEVPPEERITDDPGFLSGIRDCGP